MVLPETYLCELLCRVPGRMRFCLQWSEENESSRVVGACAFASDCVVGERRRACAQDSLSSAYYVAQTDFCDKSQVATLSSVGLHRLRTYARARFGGGAMCV